MTEELREKIRHILLDWVDDYSEDNCLEEIEVLLDKELKPSKKKRMFKKALEIKVKNCISEDNDVSWGSQDGILISKGDAKTLIRLLEK